MGGCRCLGSFFYISVQRDETVYLTSVDVLLRSWHVNSSFLLEISKRPA